MATLFRNFIALSTLTFISLSFTACTTTNFRGKTAPMVIKEQGSFAVG